MRLVKLAANKDSFHPVFFHQGINIIVGKKSNPAHKLDGNTFNGVGKSLLVHLVHFCLCSNKVDAFEVALPDWVFTLIIQHREKTYSFSRSTCHQSTIVINGVERKLSEGRELLFSMAVDINEIPQGLSFQALLSKFARRYRSCYIKYDCSNSYNNPYNELLANGFLLGLDSELISRKKTLRDEQDGLKKTERTLKKDPTFREYYCGQGDPQLDVDELEFSIGNLETELAEFKVSSNYHEIEAKANSVSFEKKALENNRAVIENNIKNIRKLQVQVGHPVVDSAPS